jgi:hypothetical protein
LSTIACGPGTYHIQLALHAVLPVRIFADGLPVYSDNTGNTAADFVDPNAEDALELSDVENGKECIEGVMRRNTLKVWESPFEIIKVAFAEVVNLIPRIRPTEDGNSSDKNNLGCRIDLILVISAVWHNLAEVHNIHIFSTLKKLFTPYKGTENI